VTRTAAQRAAYEQWAPATRLHECRSRVVDPDLAGAVFWHKWAGWAIVYVETVVNDTDGEEYIVGRLAYQRGGTKARLGSRCSFRRDRLRRIR
jgi:hypothetical protein